MAIVLEGLTANSYVDLTEANDYFLNRPNAQVLWQGLTDTEKENNLVFACLLINACEFAGVKTNKENPLQFPRDGQATIPNNIKLAQLEQTLYFLQNPDLTTHLNLQMMGVEMASIDGIYYNYGKGSYFSFVVKQLLDPYLVINNPIKRVRRRF